MEERNGSSSKGIADRFSQTVDGMRTYPRRIATRLLMPLIIDAGVSMLEFDENSRSNIELLKEPLSTGHKLIIAASHQSQGDLGPMVRVANMVREMFPEHIEEFNFFVAKSMGSGDQGEELQRNYKYGVLPWFAANKINPIEVVTDNDINKRGMTRDIATMYAGIRTLKKTKAGILIFPEGGMEGGKRGESGEINGVGEMDVSSQNFFNFIVEKDIKVVILALGIDGANNLFDPETKQFTPEGGKALSAGVFYRLSGIDAQQEMVGSYKIGPPFTTEDLKTFDNPGHEVMARVAVLQPLHAQGKFRSANQ